MVEIKRLIRFDWAIKNILRDKANFVILEGFISELLKQTIKILEILESESNQENQQDKFNRVDLLVKLENGELVIIEIQNENEYDYLQRVLYGTSKVITEHITIGTSYLHVKKVISISIVYFDLGHGTDYVYHGTTNFIGIHNKDKLALSDDQKTLFKKEEAYQVFPEYYILKINKFDTLTRDGLDEWIYFLKNDEIMDTFKAKGLKEAKEKLDVLKMSKKDKANYDSYLLDLSLKASLAMSQNFKLEFEVNKAIKETEAKTKIETEKQIKTEMATNMKKRGMSFEEISEITGLTIKEIEGL